MAKTDWRKWRHVTKLDPDKSNPYELIELVCASGTDAILIGGTQNITWKKVYSLLEAVKEVAHDRVPVCIEVSDPQAVIPGGDLYFIPVVLNTSELEWLIGAHQRMFLEMGPLVDNIPLEKLIVPEGYIILNSTCAAAQKAKVRANLSLEEVLSFIRVASFIYRIPLIYLEYSGVLGDLNIVREVKKVVKEVRLFYGGGIETSEQASTYSRFVDTLVVGNVIYKNPAVLKEIVMAVKET